MAREAPYLISTSIRVNGLVNKFCITCAADALTCRKTAPIAEHRAKEAIRADAICAGARRGWGRGTCGGDTRRGHGAGDMGPGTWGRGHGAGNRGAPGVKSSV